MPRKSAEPFRTLTRIDGRLLGLGVGMTGVVFYLGCIVTMSTVPREKSITFFNSLLHGIDVAPILRAEVSFFEVGLGIVSTFVLGWFAGAMIAGFYNLAAKVR
ncbi:MAG: DUF5676 family membrane protein [Verrucomicrobiales bacterium]